MTNGLVMVAIATAYAAMAAAAAWMLGIRQMERQGHRTAAKRESTEIPERMFRRPAEFGPLLRPWDEIEHMRVAILADQLAAAKGVSAGIPERAASEESTATRERAVQDESTGEAKRAVIQESTVVEERAEAEESAGGVERLDSYEHVLYWLAHWQDHVLSLTGRGVPA